jgi:hypothetical protein
MFADIIMEEEEVEAGASKAEVAGAEDPRARGEIRVQGIQGSLKVDVMIVVRMGTSGGSAPMLMVGGTETLGVGVIRAGCPTYLVSKGVYAQHCECKCERSDSLMVNCYRVWGACTAGMDPPEVTVKYRLFCG